MKRELNAIAEFEVKLTAGVASSLTNVAEELNPDKEDTHKPIEAVRSKPLSSAKFLSSSADPLPIAPNVTTTRTPQEKVMLSRHRTFSNMLQDGEYHEVWRPGSISSRDTLASFTSRESLDERRRSLVTRINTYRSGGRNRRREQAGLPSEAELEHRLQQWRQIEEDALGQTKMDTMVRTSIDPTHGTGAGLPHQVNGHTESSPLELSYTHHSSFVQHSKSVPSTPIFIGNNFSPACIGDKPHLSPSQPSSRSVSSIELTPTCSSSRSTLDIQQRQTPSPPVTITLTPAPFKQQPHMFVFPEPLQSKTGREPHLNEGMYSYLPANRQPLERWRYRSNISVSEMEPIAEEGSSSGTPLSVDVFEESSDSSQLEDNLSPPLDIVPGQTVDWATETIEKEGVDEQGDLEKYDSKRCAFNFSGKKGGAKSSQESDAFERNVILSNYKEAIDEASTSPASSHITQIGATTTGGAGLPAQNPHQIAVTTAMTSGETSTNDGISQGAMPHPLEGIHYNSNADVPAKQVRATFQCHACKDQSTSHLRTFRPISVSDMPSDHIRSGIKAHVRSKYLHRPLAEIKQPDVKNVTDNLERTPPKMEYEQTDL